MIGGGFGVGGHAVELLDYDLDAVRVWIGNSWVNARWGLQPGGIGYTSWSDLARDLSDSALDSGRSEACVVTDLNGWQPKVLDWRGLYKNEGDT